jgi:glycosyltransferase involved in cell wall biosynthesis
MSGWHGNDRSCARWRLTGATRTCASSSPAADGDGSLKTWRALTEELGLTDRVAFRGPLYGPELDELIARCDVGVGSLGMYRYGLSRGMTLKLREYMARGLPFISAVDDPALPPDAAFALRVPNDDTPVDMEAVVAFARRAKSDAALGEAMRAYARERLSWEGVLRGVLERVQA